MQMQLLSMIVGVYNVIRNNGWTVKRKTTNKELWKNRYAAQRQKKRYGQENDDAQKQDSAKM